MTRAVCLLALLAAASFGPASGEVYGDARIGSKPVADAVVWLEAPEAPRSATPAKAVLDQKNMTFSPRVLVVRKGTDVTVPNDDLVFHDVFSDHDGQKFSLGLYPVGTVRHILFDQIGLSRIYCHIHPQMGAYVMVVDSPYFAVTDKTGHFTMPPVPIGDYRYHAWRPGGPTLDDHVTVTASTLLGVRW